MNSYRKSNKDFLEIYGFPLCSVKADGEVYYAFRNVSDLLVNTGRETWERHVTCPRLSGEVFAISSGS